MAVLKAEVEFDFSPIQELVRLFPELGGRYLSLVGKRSRVLLKEQLLSGQEITLNAYPTDSKGKNTITSDVNKKRTQVKIYSYPANLFERGRMLNSGKKERGKYIITKKLKGLVEPRIPNYIAEFESRILNPEIHNIGLGE